MGGKGELMEQVTIVQLMWMMIALIAAVGLLILLSAFVTGYLVFRTKRETHEQLIAPGRVAIGGPQNVDEFSFNEPDEGDVLPPVIQQMNERMGAILAEENLKKEKV